MSDPAAPEVDRVARRRTAWVLLGLTAAAAALRFTLLGRPALWGDEALVYWRTCGTFAQLLAVLHGDAFPPLHYELCWLLVHAMGGVPGPAAMRAVPALCGTLLVPAVYALARQLLPRRPSLWAAGLTATNAFALFYSRDAKMYAEAWLAMTLAVAASLAWVRTGRATAWLAWVAAGGMAAGLQTLTLVPVVGLGPVLLLTQRRAHWRQGLLWMAGAGLIAAGPAGYYARFNTWTDRVDARGWQDSGLAWVADYNYGRTGPQQVRYLTTTFLTGWEWPRPVAFDHMPAGRGWLLLVAATLAVLATTAGLLPWPRHWRPTDEDGSEPPWRVTLWLGAWIALPLYGFYCRSNAGFATPASLWAAHPRAWVAATVALAVGGVAGLIARPTRAAAVRGTSVAVAVVLLIIAAQGIGVALTEAARSAAAAGRPWESVWVPRYLGFVWPAVAVTAGASVARLPTTAGRWSAAAVVVAVNLGLWSFRLFGSTEPPVERMAADVWAAQPVAGQRSDTLTWTDLTEPAQGGNGGGHLLSDPGRYYLQRLAGRPMSPDAFERLLGTVRLHRDDPADDLPAAVRSAGLGLRHVIVWQQADPGQSFDADADVAAALPGWTAAPPVTDPVRDVWTGQDLSRYRRWSFDRPPPPPAAAEGRP